MARIEKIKCLLKSIDDESKVLEIIPENNVIYVQTTYPETKTPNIIRYPYDEKLEWQDQNLLDHVLKKVEIQLVDGVVDKIIPLT